jgi:hypothetical protein
MHYSLRLWVCSAVVATAALQAHAQQSMLGDVQQAKYTELVAGPLAVHFSNEQAHKHVVLLGFEQGAANGWLYGVAAFRNSFGQPSAYLYYGHRWDGIFGKPSLYLKLSGGLLYGYKGKYENKVPFNHHGLGVGIIPAVGYQLTPKDAVQAGLLGTAGMIFTYNRRF